MITDQRTGTFDFLPSSQYCSLQGDGVRSFLEEFNARADELYGDAAKSVKVLRWDALNRVVTGSNPFALSHADNLLRPQGILTVSQADIKVDIKVFRENLRGYYVDCALVLGSPNDPDYPEDAYLARNLIEQMPGKKPGSLKSLSLDALSVPLTDVDVVKDSNSSYGLRFQLREGANVCGAPTLVSQTGLPSSSGRQGRTLFMRRYGLSRRVLDMARDSYSDVKGMGFSRPDGRVVLNCGSTVQVA